MTTPLQKAALAVIDKWTHSHPLKECAVLELREALDAEIAQAVEPVAWHPTEAAITALKRFEETCTDNDGYDVPKDTMRNLQAIGLIYRTYGDMYCITDFGRHILASPPAKAEQAQAVEPVAWYEHNQDMDAWFLAYSKNSNQSIKSRPLYLHPPQPQATTPMSDFDMRGVLASNLLCWKRLTESEAQELVCFFEKVRTAQGEKP